VPDAAAAAGDAGTGEATADDGEAAEQLGNGDAPAEEEGAGAEVGVGGSKGLAKTASDACGCFAHPNADALH
jgi:hypothetical protein